MATDYYDLREMSQKIDDALSVIEHLEKQVKALQDKSNLNRREHFAAMAMQGLLKQYFTPCITAEEAVDYADALIKALDTKQETEDG